VRRGEISIVIVIDGDVAPGFERVREVFGDNFEDNGDVGAALCIYRHGRKVVDLGGGLADAGTGRPWARDTLQLVYSATKAATATCAHLLAQRGELDLDQPAAAWERSSPRRSRRRPGSTFISGCPRPNGAGSARWSSTTRRAPKSRISRWTRFPSSSARWWPRSPIRSR